MFVATKYFQEYKDIQRIVKMIFRYELIVSVNFALICLHCSV